MATGLDPVDHGPTRRIQQRISATGRHPFRPVGIAAIDHERLAFAQDWRQGVPIHMDKLGGAMTHLMKEIRQSISKRKIKPSDAKTLIADLVQLSDGHKGALDVVQASCERLVTDNFGTAAAVNLHKFLSERASQEFINDRLEQLR